MSSRLSIFFCDLYEDFGIYAKHGEEKNYLKTSTWIIIEIP